MSVDLRTRSDSRRRAVDPDRFFGDELPAALDVNGAAMNQGLRWLDPRPLAVEIADTTWTLSWTGERVEIGRGAPARAARIRLTVEQLEDLVSDQQTFM